MAEKEEQAAGEQDDISFLRTGDIISMNCVAGHGHGLSTERVCLSAEGFGNRRCHLENISDKNFPPDIAMCMFFIDQALSVRALQEMMSAGAAETKSKGGGGNRTLLYGHAVQLRHAQSDMYLACLSSTSLIDKLAFDVGVQETNEGESAWWTIHPASKQRSEGEKVRVGDDVILVSVATERYLHMSHVKGAPATVIASFHQTLWNITSVSSGNVLQRSMGHLFGNDVVRFFHGNDECLTIPEQWSEHPQQNLVIYESGSAMTQARSLWRIELVRMKWHGALIGWEQVFRVKHITSGRYLGLASDNQVQLLHKEKADYESSTFVMLSAKDVKKQGLDEKEEEGMGNPTIKYGETVVFIQHLNSNLWLSYQTTESTKKGVGKVEEKKAIALEEGHMDDCYTFFMALEEESKSARVIRKCSSVLNNFLKGIEGLQNEGGQAANWVKVDLGEVLKLMEDLIDYFAQPAEECDFETKQIKLRALRSRQDLFQEEGVLNMILDTIDQFGQMEGLPDFTGLIGAGVQPVWDAISTYLYLLVAAMIKGNHSNCAQFAAPQRLDWLFGRLANPQSAEGILDVLYCVLTESPEALNMIRETHIKSVISLLEKVGRDPKVLDVLSSLCEGNGVAVRSSQNTICDNLLPCKDLLLQTDMVDQVSSMMPSVLVGLLEGSSWFKRWYFEAEVEHLERMTRHSPFLRIGWANSIGYVPFPGPGDRWGCNGVGDDLFSYGFDGKAVWTGGKAKTIGVRELRKGDVIGCTLDLTVPEIRFSLNGNRMEASFRGFNIDGYFFPVMSLSARVSCRFVLGGDQGRLRYGPPSGFSAIYEAARGDMNVIPCFSFGDPSKKVYGGPTTLFMDTKPFVPNPVDITAASLPQFVLEMHTQLARNMHELWAMHKIDNGWTFGEKRNEQQRAHPCLTSYEQLPQAELNYNVNVALNTLKTIQALGYHLSSTKPPCRLRPLRLGQNYQQGNGYKPAPIDTREVELDEKMLELAELLGANTHNVWAKEKIARGWTYGKQEDTANKRSSHLVPYDFVDARIQQANKEGSCETLKTLLVFGLYLEKNVVEQDEANLREMVALHMETRTYRAERSYAATYGKWYFEFMVLTPGYMKVGWMDVSGNPDCDVGNDDKSYAFDGYLGKKWHQGPELYGKEWKVNDVVGCFLDLNDKTISFSINGELLIDPSGSEMAFDGVLVVDGLVPAMTLSPGQNARINCGQDADSLRFFTTCGLQEGYEPFCVNMYRQMPLWYGKQLAYFEDLGVSALEQSALGVQRIPATGNNPPCLKITHKTAGTTSERAAMEFFKLSLPIRCHANLVKNKRDFAQVKKDKEALYQNLLRLHQERLAGGAAMMGKGPLHPGVKRFGDDDVSLRSDVAAMNKAMGGQAAAALAAANRELALKKRAAFKQQQGMAQSLDETGGALSGGDVVIEVPTIVEPPAVSQRRRIATLIHFGLYSVDDTVMALLPLETADPKVEMEDFIERLVRSGSMQDLHKEDSDRAAAVERIKELAKTGDKHHKSGTGAFSLIQSIGQRVREASAKPKKEDKQLELNKRARSADPGRFRTDRPDGGAEPADGQRLKVKSGGKKRRQPSSGGGSSSGAAADAAADDDTFEMLQLIDQVDEYYYGLQIFPGQDPAQVWVGWVTPQFHYYGQSFGSQHVRRVRFNEFDCRGTTVESIEYRSCYMCNGNELLQAINDQGGNTKVSGLLIGCTVDTSIGEVSFTASGQDTGFKFKVEPGTMLYPAAFVAPTSKECVQFELGRIKYTLPLSAAMFRSANKSLTPICPPRLRVQSLRPYHWSRVPSQLPRTTALKLNEVRGWSVLCDDPVRMMSVYVPERDVCYDVLEMTENPVNLNFHKQTLNLYTKLCSSGNYRVAHTLCNHVDQEQLMYTIKNHYLAGPLRSGFHDLLIALHLKTHEYARNSTKDEYIIPLTDDLQTKDMFSAESETRYPVITGIIHSIRPTLAAEDVRLLSQLSSSPPGAVGGGAVRPTAAEGIANPDDTRLLPPAFNFEALKTHCMLALGDATHRAVMNCRDLMGGDNLNHFEPLLKLFDSLLVIGLITDEELLQVLIMIYPGDFDKHYQPASTQKGLMEIDLAEGVKLQLCNVLNHMGDLQVRHRVESLIAFANGFVVEVQNDQKQRYLEIKQKDMPPAEAARKTKEFRCPPKEQMFRLLKCKAKPVEDSYLEDDMELDQCPMLDSLQEQLREFCQSLVSRVGCDTKEGDGVSNGHTGVTAVEEVEDGSWVDTLATFVVQVPPPPPALDLSAEHRGQENFRRMIITTLARWAKESFLESQDLIRNMFALLLRQYNGVSEIMSALEKTYVLHERNIGDIEDFIIYLNQVRGLLRVQFEHTEEAILKRALWHLMNNKVFFQHPDLMRLLSVHENVMTVMMNILTSQQAVEDALTEEGITPELRDVSEMVVACSRFLCYFCRTSRQNQKAMFEHLSFLLDNATMLLVRTSLRGSVPLDVAYSSFMDNNELALALKEDELEKVAFYLSRCGLQPNLELLAKGYPDLGWDPVEGERYVDFLRFCVWINGENVEENANLVIRLLIRRPECLGVALKGEGQGLFSAFKEAIQQSDEIRAQETGELGWEDKPAYPLKEVEGEDYIDMGSAVLEFYSSLVDLLAKCAPDPVAVQAGKGESLRARAILKSLISLDDLGAILALQFSIPNLAIASVDELSSLPSGLLPIHKQSVMLFLDRVYGVDEPEMFFHLLEHSFLPDLRSATMLDSPKAVESDIALALNRYLCNSVLPLLTKHCHFFAEAEHQEALLDATLHTVYRMNRLRSLTNNQRAAVSEFLVAITHELSPHMMIKLLRKVIVDIPELNESSLVPLKIVTLYYERVGKYYGGSGNQYGVATENERRLTMLLFSAIFDSLGSKPYDPELFGRALPCLTAIGGALAPDYTLTVASEQEEQLLKTSKEDAGYWVPKPVEVSRGDVPSDLQTVTAKFAEHFHDSWAQRKLEKGWVFRDAYSRENQTHPRLRPFALLKEHERVFYRERCSECLKALLGWDYAIELFDQDAAQRAAEGHQSAGTTEKNYRPRPVDLSNMNLDKDMMAIAERIAENSHLIWARLTLAELTSRNSSMPITLVPWDFLTDFERRKHRFRAMEIIKFLQYHGFKIYRERTANARHSRIELMALASIEAAANKEENAGTLGGGLGGGSGTGEGERSSVEKRFAFNLLEKLVLYLEHAALKMKGNRPSEELTRKNSFKPSTKDVKFFEKVVLPLINAYFHAHKHYFLSSGAMQVGIASNREKEMVATLFCRLAQLLRLKNRAFGSVAKITIKCLHGLVQALDFRTLVKMNSDIIRTSLLTFFNSAADDLFMAVKEVKDEGQYSSMRGSNLKSWTSLEFANQMALPILTCLFNHLSRNHFGADLLLDDIQAACYRILDSLYYLTSLSSHAAHRRMIKDEMDKHRPQLGQCLSAFASCFPVAFLEPEFNKFNKFSVLAKTQDQSVQVQDMLQNLSAHIPQLDKLLTDVEAVAEKGIKYHDTPTPFDVDLPLICSYLTYWWQQGPEGPNQHEQQVTKVTSDYLNRVFTTLLKLIRDNIAFENAPWMCRVAFFAVQCVNQVTSDPVKDYMLPIVERLKRNADNALREEEKLRTHPEDGDEGLVAEMNARLVRDVYSFFPLLMKYTDLHRAQWLKHPTWETDGLFENVAAVFATWSRSQHFKREELNFVAQFDEDVMGGGGGGGDMKTGKAAVAERKKKRREGVKKDKHSSSMVISCLKRLIPVGLNVFGGRELDIVQQTKEKFLQKENEDKIRDNIRFLLDIPEKTDPTDKNTWQRNLYRKIGKSQMRGKENMTQNAVVEKITNMGQVQAILHSFSGARASMEEKWKKVLTAQRKRLAISLITASHLYRVETHRGINLFLDAFKDLWLADENVGQERIISDLICEEEEECVGAGGAGVVVGSDGGGGGASGGGVGGDDELVVVSDGAAEIGGAEESQAPDAVLQLIRCFQRAATSEQHQEVNIADDMLYVCYADVMAKSIHIEEEGGDDATGDDGEGETDQAQKEEEAEQLRAEQRRLADRGAAILVLVYLSRSGGEPSDMVANTLQLGIHLLSGGNVEIQTIMLEYLQLKKDVSFFTSVAMLMTRCSVLNLEMFERQIKAEGLGMGAELAAGEHQNLNDADFTCSLFRFLQLTCEGHNLGFQNYLRAQPGNTTSVNLINATVDYLLRLQESIMDFYWHYSSKDLIDDGGKEYFLRAIQVCSQVFNTLTESIQGPCVGNQMTLANSRLWDAINGFFFLFAHMMDKLSKNSTQLELLREFLNLQKDMIVLMLSMLEGNVLNGPIGKQMVDALVESQSNVEMILKFSDMFLKLKDLTSSQAFLEFDLNKDGWISPKEFQKAMESQKMYSIEEINYLMMCTDVNNDGKVDYMEFTERFHNPAKDIGFNLAVLLTNLKEHISSDPRLEKIVEQAKSLLDYFDKYLGRIEIMGSSKRVEKVYFEIQEDWIEQWGKQQIKDSKNSFLFNVMQDDGGEEGKLDAFINFCEDTIFEMQHAASISAEDSDSRVERAMKQRDYFLAQSDSAGAVIEGMKTGVSMGIEAARSLKPSKVKEMLTSGWYTFRSMSFFQLIGYSGKLGFKTTVNICWAVFVIIATLIRFMYYLTKGKDEEKEQPTLSLPDAVHGKMHKGYSGQHNPPQQQHAFMQQDAPTIGSDFEAFGVHVHTDESGGASATGMASPQAEAVDPSAPTDFIPATPSVVYETTGSVLAGGGGGTSLIGPAGVPVSVVGSDFDIGLQYEPKIADAIASRSKSSPLNFLARNIRTIEKFTLILTFLINLILLFHRVDIAAGGEGASSGGGGDDAPSEDNAGGGGDDDDDTLETVYIEGFKLPYMAFDVPGWMLSTVLWSLSCMHAFFSLALLFAFYQLKVPLITFKREKEVARALLFNGCWIQEDEEEERSILGTIFWYIDRVVISSPSFPQKYWDKFVRKKARQKYTDAADEETLDTLLGINASAPVDGGVHSRYTLWLWFGVIVTNSQFLYRVGYLVCSGCGVIFSPFFYAAHLIDVVLSFPMLKAILQSVTHNLQQLILTIMMVLMVVYLYTVVAFNFFRKFYVSEAEEEGAEPDRKCHNMLTCFVYHFYAGVRAGGGIGDELESPYGDQLEKWRMLFDISFFFFVIVILLAIMQGLIIDAFGELRNQQESATEKLESNCFICDIGKDYFDRLPRGFETHTMKEHNFANYLFFIQHLINKDETEYTGQETYIREMYDERNWEFFPVGECFLKQYEDQLMQS